jgi:hypothetical protein
MLAQLQVSGDLAGLLRDYLEKQGDTHCELYTGLQLFSANNRMSFGQWWGLLDKLQARFPDRHVGLELGELVRSSHLGVVGYLTLASDTVADALAAFQRYQRLLHDGDKASIRLDDGVMTLFWSSDYGPSTRLSDEVLLAGLLNFIRLMSSNSTLAPVQVDFTFAPPANIHVYEMSFGSPVFFSQPHTALHFPAEYLSLPVSNSDPGLRALLERQAQASIAVLPQKESFIQALRTALLRGLQSGRAGSVGVAAMLNMSERTLFRRLNDQGLAFKHVLSQIRMQLAQEYLADARLTQSEIALLLGYSEQSAFSRAFKRETGMTPRQFQMQS